MGRIEGIASPVVVKPYNTARSGSSSRMEHGQNGNMDTAWVDFSARETTTPLEGISAGNPVNSDGIGVDVAAYSPNTKPVSSARRGEVFSANA